MNREDFIKIVETKIEDEHVMDIDKDYITENYKTSKNGIYFLYDDKDVVIYIGKVGNGKQTSFYHRMYGHGNGAHFKKGWFSEVKKFRFKSFQKLKNNELRQIERLMIYAKNQPIYNDIIISENDFEAIKCKL